MGNSAFPLAEGMLKGKKRVSKGNGAFFRVACCFFHAVFRGKNGLRSLCTILPGRTQVAFACPKQSEAASRRSSPRRCSPAPGAPVAGSDPCLRSPHGGAQGPWNIPAPATLDTPWPSPPSAPATSATPTRRTPCPCCGPCRPCSSTSVACRASAARWRRCAASRTTRASARRWTRRAKAGSWSWMAARPSGALWSAATWLPRRRATGGRASWSTVRCGTRANCAPPRSGSVPSR